MFHYALRFECSMAKKLNGINNNVNTNTINTHIDIMRIRNLEPYDRRCGDDTFRSTKHIWLSLLRKRQTLNGN